MKHLYWVLILLWACSETPTQEKINAQKPPLSNASQNEQAFYGQSIETALGKMHQKMDKPKFGDWLFTHKEKEQTFLNYLNDKQTDNNISQKWIVVLPIGTFSPKQQEIMEKTVRYLGIFYQLRTRILPAYETNKIPAESTRENYGVFQIHTRYVLDDLLKPKVKDSITCLLAFTAHDLYPEPSWNFVFGQASLRERMGVWSMNRFGNPEESEESYRTCLLHTIKTAVHEAGHIFGMHHCTRYTCCMSGSNSLEESARHPVMFCPVCTAKVGAHFQMNLVKQHQALAKFWQENGFAQEQAYYEKAGKVLSKGTSE